MSHADCSVSHADCLTEATLHTLYSSDSHTNLRAITLDCQGNQLPNAFFKILTRNASSLQSIVLNNLPEDCRICIYDLFRKIEFQKLSALEEIIAARAYKDECYIRLEETTYFPPTLHKLTLYGLGIVAVPESFAKLSRLTTLHLMNNIITSLTVLTNSNKLNSLQELDVSENSLVSIPENIDRIPSLQVLNISHNCLKKYLPPTIANLKQLTKLSLQWNRLEELSAKTVESLTNLKYLNISHNKIKSLSSTICFHPTLQCLDLSGNEGLVFFTEGEHLAQNKPAAAAAAAALLELDISSTGLHTLPLWLHQLKSLHILKADYNHLVDINNLIDITSLQVASFSHNQISDCDMLFNSLTAMTMLNMLDLSYNRLYHIGDAADTVYIGEVTVNLQGNRLSAIQDSSHDDYSSSVTTSQLYKLSSICCCCRRL